MIRRIIFLHALLFAFGAAPALAAGPWERFFELSFGDLRAEAVEAQKSGRQGLVVMYHFDACPYCTRMKNEVLARPEVQAWYKARFRAISIDTRGSQEVTGFDGRTLRENEFARARNVRATPTIQFYSPEGILRVTHVGAINDPAEFILLGEYVVAGDYVNTSFNAYKQSKQKRGS